MKYVLEFGKREKTGRFSDNQIIDTNKQGAKIAASLVWVFSEGSDHGVMSNPKYWELNKDHPRMTWRNETHFVALSRLDGSQQGSAASKLWK